MKQSKVFLPLILLFFASCFMKKKNQEKQQEFSSVTVTKQTDEIKSSKVSETFKDSFLEPQKSDSVTTVTITAVGDLMCHVTQYTYAKTVDGKYDFNTSFSEIKKYIYESDFALGNLETTFAGASSGYSGYPNFNSPDEYAEAIKNAGFDLLVMANNHSMDMGESGLVRTIQTAEKNQLNHTGTFISQHDRDSVRIFLLKGIKLGVLNYTYGTNGILPAKGNEFMLNIIDTALIKNDIIMARKQGAEIVLVFFHYGTEYVIQPTESQQFIVNKTIEYGADIILGSHPHVLQPSEFFKTKNAKLDSGFVAWSLGNFLSNQKDRYCDAGAILNIFLTKNFTKDSLYISALAFIPTWVYRGTNPLKKKHIIFPSAYCHKDSLPDFIDTASKKLMQRAFDDAKQILTKRNARLRIKSVPEEEK